MLYANERARISGSPPMRRAYGKSSASAATPAGADIGGPHGRAALRSASERMRIVVAENAKSVKRGERFDCGLFSEQPG